MNHPASSNSSLDAGDRSDVPVPSGLVRIGIAIWGVLVLATVCVLTVYSMTPGSVSTPPAAGVAGIPVGSSEFTLVMAVHPRCPCTRASVEQLQRLLARFRGQVSARVLVFHPGQTSPIWAQTDLWESMSRLPHVTLQPDSNGEIATRIGCHTSGSVVLYDRSGRPRFWGGITPGRGHSGDNPGSDHIAAVLREDLKSVRSTPVFGCDLRSVRLSKFAADDDRSVKR